MLDTLEYKQFLELSKHHDRVAVYRELPADRLTVVIAFEALHTAGHDMTLLESCEREQHVGRYSYLGFEPVALMRSFGDKTEVTIHGKMSVREGDPLEVLRDLRRQFACGSEKQLSGFAGGAFGFLSYDAIRYFEDIPFRLRDQQQFPDLYFQFHDTTVVFDHYNAVVTIVTIVDVGDHPKAAYEVGINRIDAIYDQMRLFRPENKPRVVRKDKEAVTTDLSDKEFMEVVERAKEYIVKGDAFQIVPSRCFQRKYRSAPFDIYRALRMVSPSPYMFYVESKEFALAGASPEKLVSLEGASLESIPLAGTRPRGQTNEEDVALERDLLDDPKEGAEHMMLVDLGRNDLGKIAKPGTVNVERLKVAQRFSHVMHIASFINGELKDGLDCLDALKATFPAGTLSGAPKVRAMEIIDELEASPRGPYGGAICVIDHAGNLTTCIAIRMAILKEGVATVRAGAGIVFDSVPQSEADETRHKARSVLEAIKMAEEGRI